jgi:hypothetical protein
VLLSESSVEPGADLTAVSAAIAEHLTPGCRVVLHDGVGAPLLLQAALPAASRAVGGVHLVLGWTFDASFLDTDRDAFLSVRTIMGGMTLRGHIDRGSVVYVPTRLGTLPALFHDTLRPDVLLTSAAPDASGAGLANAAEITWLPTARRAATTVLVERNHALPCAARPEWAGFEPHAHTRVVVDSDRPPIQVPNRAPPTPIWPSHAR